MKNSNANSQRDAEMKKRESELAQKMIKRMDSLEQELQDVQAKLQGAVQMIAKKDKELEELKSQILQEGMDKLDQNKINKKPQKMSVDAEQLSFKTNNQKSKIKDPNYFQLDSENIPSERRLAETVESRIKRVQALNTTDSSIKRKVENYNNISEKQEIVSGGIIENEDFDEGEVRGSSEVCDRSSCSSRSCDTKTSKQLEEEYAHLASQLEEMEKFLGDYGLIWVGDMKIPNENSYTKVQASIGFTPNFDKLIMMIGNLNEKRASESSIEVSEKSGKFKKAEVLKLAIYADGIQLEDNPFREYSSESVKEFFKDLEDGYYPTELKDSYPDGVIFRVIDKRSKTFDEAQGKKLEPFSGKGHKLGGRKKSFDKRSSSFDALSDKSNNKTGNINLPIDENKLEDQNMVIKEDSKNKYQFEKDKSYDKEKQKLNKIENDNQTYAEYDDKNHIDQIQNLTNQDEINRNHAEEISQNNELSQVEKTGLNRSSIQTVEPDNVETVLEETITQKPQSNVKLDEYNQEPNIRFRDNINITNITYNEAPIIVQDPTISSKTNYNKTEIKNNSDFSENKNKYSPEMLEDEYLKAETVEGKGKFGLTEYSDKIAANSINIENEIKRNILSKKKRELVTNQNEPSIGGFPTTEGGMVDDNEYDMTEYTNIYNTNSKNIEDAIRKYASSKPPEGSMFNKNQQFENISVLGANPQSDKEMEEDESELTRDINEEFIVYKEELQEDVALEGSAITGS